MLTISDDTIDGTPKLPTGTVTIGFNFGGRIGLVRKRPLTETEPTGGPWQDCVGWGGAPAALGSFAEPIPVGQFWQFGAFISGASNPDPSEGLPTVCGVTRIDPLEVKLVGDQNIQAGGTFVLLEIHTEFVSCARLFISSATNSTPSVSGRPRVSDPGDGTFVTRHSVGKSHRLLVEVGAGTTFGYVLQLVDTKGAELHVGLGGTQVGRLNGTFTTLRRRVKVWLDSIKIRNDGDDMGESTAEFVIGVYKDNRGISVWRVGNDDSPIDITDNQNVSTGMPPVTIDEPGNYYVSVNVHGREFDGVSESDELASTGRIFLERTTGLDLSNAKYLVLFTPTPLSFRSGPNESLDSEKQELKMLALTVNNQTFQFLAQGGFTVEYS